MTSASWNQCVPNGEENRSLHFVIDSAKSGCIEIALVTIFSYRYRKVFGSRLLKKPMGF